MKNTTVREYTQLQDALGYDAILEHVKPVNTVTVSGKKKTMNINQMPYVNVKHCMRLMAKVVSWDDVCELFCICYDIKDEQFWNMPVLDFFKAKKFMTNSLKAAASNEAKHLSAQSTDEHLWKMAGAERLSKFSDTLPLVQMGKMFGQYPFDLGRKPYGEILNLLIQVKTQNEVEHEYQKLITK